MEMLAQPGMASMADLEPSKLRAASPSAAETSREPVAKVEDRSIPGPAGPISVRLYVPAGAGPFPGLVWLHGGGFVLGDLEMQDDICRSFANAVPCLVVSVDYRLAPEHRFPAAVEDTYAATRWSAENITSHGGDATRLVVAGESAGGNLAAVVALMARDRGYPAVCFQLLVNPLMNLASFDTASYEQFATGYLLTRRDMEWIRSQYIAVEDRPHPYVSPLLARDLTGLPPALVITSEFDVLRDEGEAYARRLQEAGVPATLWRYDGMLHGFMAAGGFFDRGREARARAATVLRNTLGTR
jgi:acetyl esterase